MKAELRSYGWTMPSYIILNLSLCCDIYLICLVLESACLLSRAFYSLKSEQGQPWAFWKCSSVVIFEVIDELVTSCLPCISIFAEIRARSIFSEFWWPFWKSQPYWKLQKFRKHPSCRNVFLCQIWLRTIRQCSG